MRRLLTIFQRPTPVQSQSQTVVGGNVVALRPSPNDVYVLDSGKTVTREFVDQAFANTIELMRQEELDQDRHFIADEIEKFVRARQKRHDQEEPATPQR